MTVFTVVEVNLSPIEFDFLVAKIVPENHGDLLAYRLSE